MGELKFHIRLPIFVMRQHVRHRMASLNEESARYSELASDFYVPDPKNWAMNTAADKQATVKYEITPEIASKLHEWVTTHNEDSYRLYQQMLDGTSGVSDLPDVPPIAREQARMVLGVNIYTQCVWKIDLKNLLHYLSLRCDKHAQYEIRVFADAIARVVAALFPACWASHKDHDPFMDGVNFGASELKVLHALIKHNNDPAGPQTAAVLKSAGWGQRRFTEFKGKVVKAGFLSEQFLTAVQAAVWKKD
jgi:thymidylate synthase (FAD)